MNKIIYVLVVLMAGCGQTKTNDNIQRVFQDGLGNEVYVKDTVKKVVGLSPAVTEILFYVCEGKFVIARTQNDNYPVEVKRLPVIINYPKLDMESLLTYNPEVVFAEEGINSKTELQNAEEYGIKVFWLKLNSINDVITSMYQVTSVLREDSMVVNQLQTKLDSLKNTVPHKKHTALVMASISPMYVHGQYTIMTEKLALAGFENIVTKQFPGDYPEISREYLLQLDPDYLLGYSFEAMDTTYFRLYPEMKRLKAYQEKRIYALEADLASRPGPRIYESIMELKAIRSK